MDQLLTYVRSICIILYGGFCLVDTKNPPQGIFCVIVANFR